MRTGSGWTTSPRYSLPDTTHLALIQKVDILAPMIKGFLDAT
jgi:hypothetical protein